MAKTSSKESIARMVMICAQKGLEHVVISPGSRNAPLTLSFAEDDRFKCINIPDERVAAFFALGIAQRLMEPVILCCTSGTAALNYAPAIAEAYYQKIPLLVLTADRPLEWMDQRAGQTIRQRNIFSNYVKQSFEIIGEASQEEHLWYNDRIVNEAINHSVKGAKGPVHINVPMRESLYDLIPAEKIAQPKIISDSELVVCLSDSYVEVLCNEWAQYESILIIIGQKGPDKNLDSLIEQLALFSHVVVLTETTSNVTSDHVLPSIDRVIDSISPDEYKKFTPDLIISCGAAIVSKKIRFMLRQMKIKSHWHVDRDDGYIDTYQALTRLISVPAEYLFEKLIGCASEKEKSIFKKAWLDRENKTKKAHFDFLEKCPWSDMKVMSLILGALPSCTLHLASSTPVRYLQLFPPRLDVIYRCNRGVSGIDGCTSTAAGYARVDGEIVTLITGDIAFFYDSNALWHHHVPSNLRIILINNGGGNIFRYVKGPDQTDHLEQHFEAAHSTTAGKIASTHNVAYLNAENESELISGLEDLFDPGVGKAAILEIMTPREKNIAILKDYFLFLKE